MAPGWRVIPARTLRTSSVWLGIRRSTVFPADPVLGLFAFAGRRAGLVSARGLRTLVQQHVTFERIENAAIPLHLVAVEVLTGRDALLSSGPALEGVLASAAIPGVFAPVVIDGVPYMDGGVVSNTPISHAVDLGADQIWVMSAGYACALKRPPRGALAMGLHALTAAAPATHHRRGAVRVVRRTPCAAPAVSPRRVSR